MSKNQLEFFLKRNKSSGKFKRVKGKIDDDIQDKLFRKMSGEEKVILAGKLFLFWRNFAR